MLRFSESALQQKNIESQKLSILEPYKKNAKL